MRIFSRVYIDITQVGKWIPRSRENAFFFSSEKERQCAKRKVFRLR